MRADRVTIVVPYYNTPRIMKVCLRALRKHTRLESGHEVLVVDNGTNDGSETWLRSIPWIRRLDRILPPDELGEDGEDSHESGTRAMRRGGLSHGRAINLAWEESDAPFFLTIHSDTIVKRDDWLEFLLSRLESRPRAFATGSWKLERMSRAKRIAKEIGDRASAWFNPRARRRQREGTRPFLRSHCALYRRDALEKEGLLPFDGGATTCGQGVHYSMVDRGWEADFIPPQELVRYLDHVNHGTMVLNPELGAAERTIRKGLRKLDGFYREPWVRALEADESLDR